MFFICTLLANSVENNWSKFEMDISIGLGVTVLSLVDSPIFWGLRQPFWSEIWKSIGENCSFLHLKGRKHHSESTQQIWKKYTHLFRSYSCLCKLKCKICNIDMQNFSFCRQLCPFTAKKFDYISTWKKLGQVYAYFGADKCIDRHIWRFSSKDTDPKKWHFRLIWRLENGKKCNFQANVEHALYPLQLYTFCYKYKSMLATRWQNSDFISCLLFLL